MSHPTIFPAKIFFYPIGNTPLVCFTNGQAPEDSVDLLLLACGDPRSILYTIYADIGAKTNRHLDFTCCDADPAIIARNVLLLTLVTDEVSIERSKKIWNIFYHHYIDKSAMEFLISQCKKLTSISTDLETWHSSSYGAVYRFCTSHSLSEVRRHWELYMNCSGLSSDRREILEKSFVDGLRSNLQRFNDGLPPFTRAGGPLWINLMDLAKKSMQRYWSTGVTTCESNHQRDATLVNPTFAYSSRAEETFNTHYGTDPIMSFHLSARLAPTTTLDDIPVMKVENLIEFAQSQFHDFCTKYHSRISHGITMRFFVGDALALCKALRCNAVEKMLDAGVYTYPWGGSIIDLCPDDYQFNSNGVRNAPVIFDVIDTSNLSDHLGILNVITATFPLLLNRPNAILHTYTLHPPPDKDKKATSDLLDQLGLDVQALSMLLGIAPVSYLSGFTSHSNSHESVLPSAQFHDLVAWKKSCLGDSVVKADIFDDRLKFGPKDLGTLLFNLFLRIFENENPVAMKANTKEYTKRGISHYDRTGFANFLKIVQDRTETNWQEAIEHLILLIANDRTLMLGSNYKQDLYIHLYLRDIFTIESLTPHITEQLSTQNPYNPLQGWSNIPSVVCVAFEVPRDSLHVLEHGDIYMVGTPVLICNVRTSAFHNIHTLIWLIFGRMEITNPDGNELEVTIVEDLEAWKGKSPLVVSFYTPFAPLTYESLEDTIISLSLASTPHAMRLMPTLGLTLDLYSTSLADKDHIRVIRTRPNNDKEFAGLHCPSLVTRTLPVNEGSAGRVSVKLDGTSRKPLMLTTRLEIVNADERNALSNKAPVSIKQNSPCSVLLSFASFDKVVTFPFPIEESNSKLRVARKSFHIEVDVPLSGPLLPNGYSMKPFPLVHAPEARYSPKLWNIHYLDLDLLPALDISSKQRMNWLSSHLNLSFSDRERSAVKRYADFADIPPFINLKQSITSILLQSTGLGSVEQPMSVFSLADPEHGGGYTLIFLNTLRLDVASHTVVADACVLPLTTDNLPKIYPTLQKLTNQGAICTTVTLESEVRLWKHLLPALMERCRQWEHTDKCAYNSKGIPASVVFEESPICACGQGKALGSFMQSKWKELAPLVTRIALGPLFAVPFLEFIAEELVSSTINKPTSDRSKCRWCGGEGKPKLLVCSRCKNASYCSVACQKADWKKHKPGCIQKV